MPNPHPADHVFDREIHELYRERNTHRFATPAAEQLPRRRYGELLVLAIVAMLVSSATAALVVGLMPPAVSVPIIERQPRAASPAELPDDLTARVRGATVAIFATRTSKSPSELERSYLAREALGQGLVLSSDGWVATTQAVVRDARAAYTVLAADGTLRQAEAVVLDPVAPLAYLKVGAGQLTATPFVDFNDLTLGLQVVAAVYTTQSNDPALYLRRLAHLAARTTPGRADLSTSSESLPDRYLLDADVPASSVGAPVFTREGRAVGLVTELDGGLRGIVPLDNLGVAIDGLFSHREVVRPSLGLSYVQASWLAPFSAGSSPVDGAQVMGSSRRQAVLPKGPAAAAGLREGDRVVSFAGERIAVRSLSAMLQQYRPGARVALDIERAGKPLTITVTLGEVKGGEASAK